MVRHAGARTRGETDARDHSDRVGLQMPSTAGARRLAFAPRLRVRRLPSSRQQVQVSARRRYEGDADVPRLRGVAPDSAIPRPLDAMVAMMRQATTLRGRSRACPQAVSRGDSRRSQAAHLPRRLKTRARHADGSPSPRAIRLSRADAPTVQLLTVRRPAADDRSATKTTAGAAPPRHRARPGRAAVARRNPWPCRSAAHRRAPPLPAVDGERTSTLFDGDRGGTILRAAVLS